MEDVTVENKPKKCLARAIVSMALGIFSVEFAASSGAFAVYIPVMKQLMKLSSDTADQIAGMVFNGTFAFSAFLFIAVAVVAAIVSMRQGKKFEELYSAYGSKMVKAGRITSIVGFIISAIMLICTIIILIL